jgi:hypothetical protein
MQPKSFSTIFGISPVDGGLTDKKHPIEVSNSTGFFIAQKSIKPGRGNPLHGLEQNLILFQLYSWLLWRGGEFHLSLFWQQA